MTPPVLVFRPVIEVAAFAVDALPAAERALLSSAATAKRRAEFVAGRCAARAAVARVLGHDRCAAVIRDAAARTARPVAVDRDGAPLPAFVSITHAGGVAAAAAARRPLGIDLVEVEPLEAAFRADAFWPDELAAWERATGDVPGGRLGSCAAFGAKEAIVKWLGTGLEVPLLGIRARPETARAPTRVGQLRAWSLEVRVDSPVRCRVCAWIARLGRFLVVGVEDLA